VSDLFFLICGISIPVQRNLRDGVIKVAPFFGSEFQVYRSQILLQTFQLRCARNGNDPRFLSKQPPTAETSKLLFPSLRFCIF
jgi:hypothetical protein